MSVAGQSTVFSVAQQSAKVGNGGTFTVGDQTWYRFRAPSVRVGPVQDQRMFPPETGGPLIPSGAFKAGFFGAGNVDLIPRVENTFGRILKALMGDVVSTPDVDLDGGALVGADSHVFKFAADTASIPWIAARRTVPTSGNPLGEVIYDAKIRQLRIVAPQTGKLAANLVFAGRDMTFVPNPSWTYANTLEDHQSAPDVGNGFFKIGTRSVPVLAAEYFFDNAISSPQDEMVHGSMKPDDFTVLGPRTFSVRLTYKWNDDAFYREMLTGSAGGSTWSPEAYMVDTDGTDLGFEACYKAPTNIPSLAVPYEIRFRANRMTWQFEESPASVAGGLLTQSVIGTAIELPGESYCEIGLLNATASYA